MGGFGSGWRGPRKAAVEDGLTLSISALLEKGALIPGGDTNGTWTWFYPGHEPHARISYEAYLGEEGTGWLRLTYRANGTPVDCRVDLVTTRPTYGGSRWWFLCPLERQDGGAARRVGTCTFRHVGSVLAAAKPMGLLTNRVGRAESTMDYFGELALKWVRMLLPSAACSGGVSDPLRPYPARTFR